MRKAFFLLMTGSFFGTYTFSQDTSVGNTNAIQRAVKLSLQKAHNDLMTLLDSIKIKDTNLLPPRAFAKMTKNYFSYALTGSNAPVSGIKVETSNPTVTISGNLFVSKQKSLILNAQLVGGTDNNISQIFSGSKLNGYFKGSIGANLFLQSLTHGKYTSDNYEINAARNKYRTKIVDVVKKQVDTSVILNLLHDALFPTSKNSGQKLQDLDTLALEASKELTDIHTKISQNSAHLSESYFLRAMFPPPISGNEAKQIIIGLLRKYLEDQSAPDEALLSEFIKSYISGDIKYVQRPNDAFDADFSQLKDLGNTGSVVEYMDESSIKYIAPLYIDVRFQWLNLSPLINNNSLTFYDTISKAVADTTSLLYGVTLSWNMLKKYIGSYKFFYEQLSFSWQRSNNVADLKKLNYQINSTLASTPSTETQKTKTGTAYSGALNNGWGWDLDYQLYWLYSKAQFFPGLFLKCDLSYQSTALNKNKIAPYVGLIWNINSSDASGAAGSKTFLTLVPYISYSNLFKNYADPSLKQSKLADLFSVGINLSLPININNN